MHHDPCRTEIHTLCNTNQLSRRHVAGLEGVRIDLRKDSSSQRLALVVERRRQVLSVAEADRYWPAMCRHGAPSRQAYLWLLCVLGHSGRVHQYPIPTQYEPR